MQARVRFEFIGRKNAVQPLMDTNYQRKVFSLVDFKRQLNNIGMAGCRESWHFNNWRG
jgi:hypothetical protein